MNYMEEYQGTAVRAFEDRELLQEQPLEERAGFEPANNKVLVLPDPIPKLSKGGIEIPEDIVQREEMAQTFATLVAVGPQAWKNMTPAAQPGDRVMIAKFTGQLFTGSDGNRYRVIHDLDVIGKITKQGVKK